MDCKILIILSCAFLMTSAWSVPLHSLRTPMRITRHALPPHPSPHRRPGPAPAATHEALDSDEQWRTRPKRDHDDYGSHHSGRSHRGVTGPIHTFVKTDPNANYKWGVRHHVGNKYAS